MNSVDYPIIGKGVYGTVYQMDAETCMKVNKNAGNNAREVELYLKYQASPLFPKMFDQGRDHIIMELIRGESLRSYLDAGKILDRQWLEGLTNMFEKGLEAGLSLNPNARHIILTKHGSIRLVDLEDIIKFASPKPFMLFHCLAKYGQKKLFLDYVKKHNRRLYDQWALTAGI